MTRSLRVGSLSLTLPIGWTILISAAILIVVVGACEALVRDESVRSRLVTPVISGHNQIAAKLNLLAELEQERPVDCFFVGSSLVLRGIDPEVVGRAYSEENGGQLRCFNFGLSGMNIEGAERLSQILIEQHHPRLIVYGTSFRDFVEQFGFGMDIPWARHKLGQPSLDGWLETSFISYRYALAYAHQEELAQSGLYSQGYSSYGYQAVYKVFDVSEPPNRKTNSKRYDAMQDYMISDHMRASLRETIGLQASGTTIVVVEMPMPVSALNFMGNPEQDYQHFAGIVTAETAAQSTPFWPTLKSDMIPDNGWSDNSHMNRTGATVFSEWLGRQLAALAR